MPVTTEEVVLPSSGGGSSVTASITEMIYSTPLAGGLRARGRMERVDADGNVLEVIKRDFTQEEFDAAMAQFPGLYEQMKEASYWMWAQPSDAFPQVTGAVD